MKSQIKHPLFYLAAMLVVKVNLLYSQPEFPKPDIKNTIDYEGDFELSGNQTMTIEHTYYKINGNVILYDNAQLNVCQSIIELSGEGRAVKLTGTSVLRADTTIFGGANASASIDPSQAEMLKGDDMLVDNNSQLIMNNCFSQTQTFMGNSRVEIRNSFLIQEPLGIVHVEANADVLIEDSKVGAFFLGVPQNVPVTIDSLQPGYLEYWSARERISNSLTYNLVLRRATLADNAKGYKGGMELGWNIAVDALNSIITISNSKLNKLIIRFPQDEPAFITDLVLRQPMDFDLNNIHLMNTEIQTQWGVFMTGGPAEIFNSEGLFIFMTGGNADIRVYDSEVGEIDPRNYTGTLYYDNSTWLGGYEIFDNSHITIRGSVRMLPSVPIFDETSTMTRNYDVFLRNDSDGSPFSDINLTLSKDGTAVWSGSTDAEGKVNFDILFNKANHDDKWILHTNASNINLNKTFSIYISNPVMINLELAEDGIHYRSVMHVAPGTSTFPLGTSDSPYPAIQEAIANSGGEIIYVHPGDYPGYIAPGQTRGGLTLDDSVTIFGAGADSTTLEGIILAEKGTRAHIRGFTIEDGIQARRSSITLTNSIIANNSGVAIWGIHTNYRLINNVFASNGQDAIFLHDSSTALIRNNIIASNGGFGIMGLETASATIDYNNVWGNTENYFESFPAGNHDISDDPLFAAPGFYLQSGSLCIDAGDPDPVFNDPDGSRNDMGAFGGPYSPAVVTGVKVNDKKVQRHYTLHQNNPNPFNSQTIIRYELPKTSWVQLTIYSITGRKIRTLVNEEKGIGFHKATWDGKNDNKRHVGNGVYFCQIRINEFSKTLKVLLIK